MNIFAITSSQMPFRDNPTDGAGYRTWNLLTRLAKEFDVNIISLHEALYKKRTTEIIEENGLAIQTPKCSRHAIARLMDKIQPDFIYLGSWPLYIFLPDIKTPLITDFIGSSLLENIHLHRYPQSIAARLKLEAFSSSDLIICSNERLKYYLTGFLTSRGSEERKNSIRVVPVSPPTEPPTRNENFRAIKSASERLILVAGSLNPWYDYETIFKAARKLKGSNFQIFFMGDNPDSVKLDVRHRILDIAERHGLLDITHVGGFTPFKDRANIYLQADIGLNVTAASLEDELSSRARLVDYLWAGIPVITSGRDFLSQLMLKNNCASYFDPGDSEALSTLIKRILYETPEKTSTTNYYSNVLDMLRLDHYVPELVEFMESLSRSPRTVKSLSLLARLSLNAFNLRRIMR